MAVAKDRTDEEIINQIKGIIEEYVKPAVASHGGVIDFVSYKDGHLSLILGGACSGCASSTITLKMGVENMVKHYVPEVHTITAEDDPNSTVDPYYAMDPFMENFDQYESWNADEPNKKE
jgi:Fe-S cluster biogenesis protein NfuA|tara:strand:+ start:560 stop:919 length:360 start_codon:yes stop_codon:yes gene_type:complete